MPIPLERVSGGVVVVESDPGVCQILKEALAVEGVESAFSDSPADGISIASSMERVDLLVVDHGGGDGNLKSFLEAFQFHHPLASIVAMTTDPRPENRLEVMRSGANEVLIKPFTDPSVPITAMRNGLARARALHEMALALPEVNRLRADGARLRREMDQSRESFEAQVSAFEESQEVFYLDLSRMMTIIDNILDGIVFTDRDAKVTLLNPASEHFLGVKSFVAIGKQITDLQGRGELLEVVAEDQSRVLEEDTVSRIVEIPCKNQDLLYIKVSTTAVTDYRGNFAGLLTVLQDVTTEFKADQLKNQFLSIVSHELRTPLTGIKTFITMMIKGALGSISEQQNRVLETVREQTHRLEHQIDKLISLGMLDQEEFAQDFEVFSVTDVVNSAANSLKSEAADHEVILAVQLPSGAENVQLHADRQNIKRVLHVLLENAVKFNRRKGRVELSVVVGPDEVLFRVSDTGIGIDARYHKRVFEKFFQVEAPLTRQYGGAGLGLTVAQRILRSHKSNLSLTSALGEGATFQFSLFRYKPEIDKPQGEVTVSDGECPEERRDG